MIVVVMMREREEGMIVLKMGAKDASLRGRRGGGMTEVV